MNMNDDFNETAYGLDALTRTDFLRELLEDAKNAAPNDHNNDLNNHNNNNNNDHNHEARIRIVTEDRWNIIGRWTIVISCISSFECVFYQVMMTLEMMW